MSSKVCTVMAVSSTSHVTTMSEAPLLRSAPYPPDRASRQCRARGAGPPRLHHRLVPRRGGGRPPPSASGLRQRNRKLGGRTAALRGTMKAVAESELSFAGLLRQFRAEARLTQEELAEAAGVSPRSVSDLERGINRTARKDTAVLLADALGLTGQVRVLFVAAARGRAPAAEVLTARPDGAAGGSAVAVTRSLPRDIGSFTGRETELARLLGTLAGVAAGDGPPGLCVIDGMAGIGKTTLAVHAAHRLAGGFPDGQFFLPLQAHAPGQPPVSPADALASLLLTAGVAVQHIPPGLEARAGRWRDHIAGKKILLLLDDAAGHEQVRPLLPGTAGSLVLVTS